MNIRHDLDPEKVKKQIEKKIADHEMLRARWKTEAVELQERYARDKEEGKTHLWVKIPEGPAYVDPMINEWNERERDYYSKVRVIDRNNGSAKPFILVYGDNDDATVKTGTGGFATFDDAANWFLNSGR